MEKERRRRNHAQHQDNAGGKHAGPTLKAVGIAILLIFSICAMQFVLLTRHVEHPGDHGVGLFKGGVTDSVLREVQAHDSTIKALVAQQKDLLRLTSELGDSLQKQHVELKHVEAVLPAAGVDSSAAQEIANMRRHVAELEARVGVATTVVAATAEAGSTNPVPPVNSAGSANPPPEPKPPAPAVGVPPIPPASGATSASADSSAEHKFPDDWLKHYTQAELEASAREAEKWRQGAINAFLHSWKGYKEHAWGHDEMNPSTGRPARVWASCGLQILDALSTIWVMGLTAEFDEATKWVENSLNWNHQGPVSFFEITIRALGGLASAHALSGREVFLRKAKELADKMMPAFSHDNGFPATQVNLQTGQGKQGWFHGTVLAEAGTVQLEFRYISQQTGDPKYGAAADRSMRSIAEAAKGRGLVPWGLNGRGPPHFQNNHYTFGAMGDSYYEYLLKMWVQTDKTEQVWKDQWKKAMAEMNQRLIKKTSGGLTYIAEENNGQTVHKMDHLACFVGGMLVYGARTLPATEVDPSWEETAAGITETCYEMYKRQPSHLAPECVSLRPGGSNGRDMEIWQNAAHYLLRPEAAEAIFYMFYYTGNPKYRRMAGLILEAIEAHTKTAFGYSAVKDVRQPQPQMRNEMETFFLAETLKYLYLTFVPNPREVLSLDEFVFTTEAHPIRILRNGGSKSGFLAKAR